MKWTLEKRIGVIWLGIWSEVWLWEYTNEYSSSKETENILAGGEGPTCSDKTEPHGMENYLCCWTGRWVDVMCLVKQWLFFFFLLCRYSPSGPWPPHYRCFTITLRHTTVGRTPLDEWSARCRNFYMTTHNTHKTQISVTPGGFEPAIPTSEWRQNHTLDRAATGIDIWL